MTWGEAADLWHRADGSVMFGLAVYLYLSRRTALRQLRRMQNIAAIQEAAINSLLAIGRAHGLLLPDPRDGSDDEPRRLH